MCFDSHAHEPFSYIEGSHPISPHRQTIYLSFIVLCKHVKTDPYSAYGIQFTISAASQKTSTDRQNGVTALHVFSHHLGQRNAQQIA